MICGCCWELFWLLTLIYWPANPRSVLINQQLLNGGRKWRHLYKMQGNVNNNRITQNKVNANLCQLIEHPGLYTYWTAQNITLKHKYYSQNWKQRKTKRNTIINLKPKSNYKNICWLKTKLHTLEHSLMPRVWNQNNHSRDNYIFTVFFILFYYFILLFSLRCSTLHSAVMHHEAGLPTHNQTSEEEEAPSMHRGPVALLLPEGNASGTMQSHPDVER